MNWLGWAVLAAVLVGIFVLWDVIFSRGRSCGGQARRDTPGGDSAPGNVYGQTIVQHGVPPG